MSADLYVHGTYIIVHRVYIPLKLDAFAWRGGKKKSLLIRAKTGGPT